MRDEWHELLAQHAEAFSAFIATAEQLPPSKRDTPGVCGVWSPKDVAAHMIHWEAEAANRFKAFLNGKIANKTYDVNSDNALTVTQYHDAAWEQVMTELVHAHEKLLNLCAVVESGFVETDSRFTEWLNGRVDDLRLHTEQLREWL